ncbi:MAG TPA: HepT-like ribonuclease domain-containing protein [Rhizomicrobium sp.]
MPKPPKHALYLDDMRQAAADIAEYVEGYDYARFKADKKTVDAVLRKFEVVGEASSRIPPEVQVLAPDIDWRGIKSFRNLVAHFYRGVDLEMVWKLIHGPLQDLPQALARLKAAIPR